MFGGRFESIGTILSSKVSCRRPSNMRATLCGVRTGEGSERGDTSEENGTGHHLRLQQRLHLLPVWLISFDGIQECVFISLVTPLEL